MDLIKFRSYAQTHTLDRGHKPKYQYLLPFCPRRLHIATQIVGYIYIYYPLYIYIYTYLYVQIFL